jgi:hypothetical protein
LLRFIPILAMQQGFGLGPTYLAQVPSVFPEQVKLTKLMGHLSAVDQLNSPSNGWVPITDHMGWLP